MEGKFLISLEQEFLTNILASLSLKSDALVDAKMSIFQYHFNFLIKFHLEKLTSIVS